MTSVIDNEINYEFHYGGGDFNDSSLMQDFGTATALSNTGITGDMQVNYKRFMINKILIIYDNFLPAAYGFDKTRYMAEQNVNWNYLRYRFVDPDKIPGKVNLTYHSSEMLRQIRFGKLRKIKHTWYPRCQKTAQTSDELIKGTLNDQLKAMDAKQASCRMHIGWAPFVGLPPKVGDSIVAVEIACRIRVYVSYTFSSKVNDTDLMGASKLLTYSAE